MPPLAALNWTNKMRRANLYRLLGKFDESNKIVVQLIQVIQNKRCFFVKLQKKILIA